MSTSSSDPKGAPPGGRKKGDTVPSLDARAAAEEAMRKADEKLGLGETLILPPPDVPGRGAAEARGVDPDATARLPRRDLVSPHEGTVLMPTVAPPEPGPVQARRGEPDTQPGLPATELVPVRELLPEVFGTAPRPGTPPPAEPTVVLRATEAREEPGAHEGTMLMPAVAAPPPPEAAAHEGTMLMPAVAAPPPPEAAAHEGTMLMPVTVVPPRAEDTRPDLVPPRTPEGARAEPPPAADLPSEPTVLTAADIIRQTFAEEPHAEGRTIKVTQGNLPELRLPELPELPPEAAPPAPAEAPPSAPGPEAAEADPELPRSTLHMPFKDMPEARRLPPPAQPSPEPPTEAWAPVRPAPEPAQAPATAILPGSAARTAALGLPQGAPVGDAAPRGPEAEPPRGASGLLWFGIVLAILVVGGGLFVWKAGLLEGRAKAGGTPAPGPGKAPTPPAGTEVDDAASVPEPMRPAYTKALAGDPNAMQFIATCYMQGLYVNRDPQKGLRWYRRAAAAGSAAAQRDLQALEAQGIR
ncbi:MAG: SEL1-like repeat protein [Holophagaceae bacterium]